MLAGAVGASVALAGCSAPLTGAPQTNVVTITYDRAGETETVSFHPPDAECQENAASTLRDERPFGYLNVAWTGADTTLITGWFNGDHLVYFEGYGVREDLSDDATLYSFTADGVVYETAAAEGTAPSTPVDSGIKYEGSIAATVRCATD